MIRRALLVSALLLLVTSGIASRVHAATFDLIYTDVVNVTFSSTGAITLAGTDFGLVVNKGTTDIGASEFFGTKFTVSSSRPEMALYPFINNPGPVITPIHPNQALGSVSGFNGVLTTKLLPGETLHNTAGLQVIAFELMRTYANTYAGPVAFDVTMTMGGNVARFTIVANVTLGGPADFAISFPSAARVSSVSTATPVRATTWGTIKTLYR